MHGCTHISAVLKIPIRKAKEHIIKTNTYADIVDGYSLSKYENDGLYVFPGEDNSRVIEESKIEFEVKKT